MSRNMGTRTNTRDHFQKPLEGGGGGSVIARKCLACGKDKKPGQSHPDSCSKEMQRMHRRGEI
tara:strand:- start:2789 stop:2977 length:189 start_codon:yes stop_codon:yes gene_type:complete